MKLILWLVVIWTAVACDRVIPLESYDCPDVVQNNRASFILECIKNGNPQADEDPEDWIPLCEEMSIHLYCHKVQGFRIWGTQSSGFIPCSQAKTPLEKKICLI